MKRWYAMGGGLLLAALVLSTCLRGDSNQRYLVLAKRTAESPAP